MPLATATPPVIVHDVGNSTEGSSPVVESGTEIRTGSLSDGPSEAAVAAALDVSADAIAIEADGEGLDGEGLDGEGLDGEGLDGEGLDGEGLDGEGLDGETAGGVAVVCRLPACLPTKNAATHSPIRTTNPATARFRLFDELIEPTSPLT